LHGATAQASEAAKALAHYGIWARRTLQVSLDVIVAHAILVQEHSQLLVFICYPPRS
jgi:hypothetical protein